MTQTTKQTEQLKDRRDYRQTLIHRRAEIDRKIFVTEAQIRKLNEPEK